MTLQLAEVEGKFESVSAELNFLRGERDSQVKRRFSFSDVEQAVGGLLELVEQLAVGGRLIVPVGDDMIQELIVIDRTPEGFVERVHDRVKFVPLLSGTSVR